MITAKPLEVCEVAGRDAAADALVEVTRQVAHEFNNQLATILGKSEIALMVDDPARWKSAVEASQKAGQKARLLVSDLQRLIGWHHEPGATRAPLSDVIGLLRRICERRLARASVVFEPAHAPARALPDPLRVFLALWLVLVEALGRGGSEISATWTLSGDESAPGGSWSLQIVHPGARWDAAARELGPEDASSGHAAQRLGQALRLMEQLGGRLEIRPESVLFAFPD